MLYALPTLTEDKVSSYISGNYTGSYTVQKSFTATGYALPMIMIKAGKFREIEPQTDVYEGDLAVSVLTQVDDVADPVGTHDATVAAVYDLMKDTDSLYASVNQPTGTFHLFSFYSAGYDQDRVDRALVSVLDYKINCQTLAISS